MAENKARLLFDGDCGLCTVFADWARRMDRTKKFAIVPYQFFSEDELRRFGTSRQKCSQRMYAITPRGRVYAGAFALNYFGWRFFPWRLLVMVIYLVPVCLLCELVVYELVAQHRRRLSQWLGMQACVTPRPYSQPFEKTE
ncbi:MAG: thiol-disulfide oxidoreductase DCC family protein [bacterium]